MMSNKGIIIWTEGGKGIGLGHVRRCLVIAHELKERGIDVLFFVNGDPTANDWIKREGFNYKVFSLTKSRVSNTAMKGSYVFLIDTKKPVTELIRRIKKKGCKIILMDNETPTRIEADTVIYPTAIYQNNLDWTGFKGKVFGGADYIPIAGSFIRIREKVKQRRFQPPYQVLVTMGGSDPNHLTSKVVSSLLDLAESDHSLITHHLLLIKIVIGPAFSSDPDLDNIEKQYHHNVEFIKGKDDLSVEMAESHVAVTALGTTILELAFMGTPSIVIANYKTDKIDMKAFEKLGISLPLGYYEEMSDIKIKQTVNNLLKDKMLWENMSQKGKILIDGCGAKRIADIVEKMLSD
jgi:spore coat polysaccharide biosynthesis predicted glycosyltransferase SpsG